MCVARPVAFQYKTSMAKLSRRVLSRAADSSRLGSLVLRTPPLARTPRRAADRYLAGDTLEQAAATIDRLHAEGYATAIDSFGEAVTERERIEGTVALYLRINRELAHRTPAVNVWVDLSNLGLDISSELCLRSVKRIVETLPEGALLQVRAHDSGRTDRILDLALRLAADDAPIMPTLQAHLRRSPEDARRLIAARVPVLLVKGTTLEPREVAHPWGEETDLAFLRLARELHAGGVPLSIGTHDPVLREALLAGLDDVGVEMLLGVRPEDGHDLLRRGHRVRIYAPFGPHWLRYWVRRLAEARGA
jgi:proline dehydrogenase